MGKIKVFKGKPIPKFKSYEEEASFWDTHSPLDYGIWKEVKLEVAKPLVHILGVRLDARTIDRLTQLGSEIGIGPSTLVRMWVMEKLKTSAKKSGSSKDIPQVILHKISKSK